MNILDENITRDQADLLARWGIRARSLSKDLAAQGIADDNVIPLLLRLKKPTLLTRDSDFFEAHLAHKDFSLVYFDVDRNEAAFFIRRFLRDARFRSAAQRLGKVFRVHQLGIEYFERGKPLAKLTW